jgi:hypothetical protein
MNQVLYLPHADLFLGLFFDIVDKADILSETSADSNGLYGITF